jgi:O-acetyl-ADP-ribose deacetylase
MSIEKFGMQLPSGQKLSICLGDITEEPVDTIVNASNSHLRHGAGVAGAILSRGGDTIRVESEAWIANHGPVSHDAPAYTHAGNLPCHYVIHAVGPVWGSGDEDRKLSDAIRGSLALAEKLSLHSIAIPAISTGIFGFPIDRAARIMIDTILQYFKQQPTSQLQVVKITIIDWLTLGAFLDQAQKTSLPS